MHASPEAGRFAAFVDRATRRARWLAAVFAVAVALAASALIVFLLGGRESAIASATVTLAFVAAAIAWTLRRTSSNRVVSLVERRTPASRNLVLTAAEMLESKPTVAPYIAARIYEDATRVADAIDLRSTFPLRTATIALVAAVLTWSGAMAAAGAGTRALIGRVTGVDRSHPAVDTIEVEVVPPAYTGQRAVTLRDPERIEAVGGSQLRLTISANAVGHPQAQAGLSVLDTDVLTTLTLTLPASVAEGATAQATLVRDGLGDEPLTVNLTSLDTTEATVPATATFASRPPSSRTTLTVSHTDARTSKPDCSAERADASSMTRSPALDT